MIHIKPSILDGGLCVAAIHCESRITGHAFRKREGNEGLYRAFRESELDGTELDYAKWPVLAEMRHEALQRLVDAAEAAQNIHHEAFGILAGDAK